eukprot:m.6116 g.6116  ORF g.6116 m.6116 type:complete len:433 (-) comp3801_c0_seq1:168-1466(-)
MPLGPADDTGALYTGPGPLPPHGRPSELPLSSALQPSALLQMQTMLPHSAQLLHAPIMPAAMQMSMASAVSAALMQHHMPGTVSVSADPPPPTSRVQVLQPNPPPLLDIPSTDERLIDPMTPSSQPSTPKGGMDKPHTCDLCSYRTGRRHDLTKHMRVHNRTRDPKSPEKKHVCPETHCDYRTARKHDLQKHMRVHTGEKPYVCTKCGYRASVKSHLTQHIRVHTGEKPHACSECPYRASVKSQLVRHVRSHSGEKPCACDHCDYRAAHKSDLATHIMRRHTGEKPYKCEQCDYRAATKSHVTRHAQTHRNKPRDIALTPAALASTGHTFMETSTSLGRNPLDTTFLSVASSHPPPVQQISTQPFSPQISSLSPHLLPQTHAGLMSQSGPPMPHLAPAFGSFSSVQHSLHPLNQPPALDIDPTVLHVRGLMS